MGIYRTKKEYVYEELKEKIMKGVLEPGTRLVYKEISNQLDVSENPVREAIQKLHTDGLVEIKPHVGTIVAIHSKKEFANMYEVKILLETKAFLMAADNMHEEDFIKLYGYIEEAEKAFKDNNLIYIAEINKKFHLEIYKKSNNPYLVKLIDDIWTVTYRYNLAIFSESHVKTSLNEHKQILEALCQKDYPLIEKLIVDHQRNSIEKILKVVDERIVLKNTL